MKKEINLRLILISVLAILVTTLSITFVYYKLLESQIRDELIVNAKLLEDTNFFTNKDINQNEIDLSTDIDELRVTWVDSDGTVLYDNDASYDKLENHLDRPEIKEAFETGTGEAVRESKTFNEDTYYYAILLENNTVLRVSVNTRSIWAIFISVLPTVLAIVVVIILICVLISQLLTRQLIKPINDLANNLENPDYDANYKELEPFAKKIRDAHNEVLNAAKMRQDFTANVSHELKTPLTAISGYSQLLESGVVSNDQQVHFYQEIKKSSDRLLTLINDIIRLSQLDRITNKPDFEEFDLAEVVNECMEEFKLMGKQQNVTITYEKEPCFVMGNKAMLKELVENLVFNGIRYNKPNGNVEIITKQSALIVKDNGIGIPEQDQAHVFERFYRVDKSRSKASGGTGLGLAIVKHIVEIHDAKIELKSALGQGTTITVTF